MSIETRFRESDDLWRITRHTIENQKITLKSLEIELAIKDIYENVSFDKY